MFFSLAYAVVCLLLETLAINARPNAGLSAEVLALHHQLRVLERQVGRPRWQPADRVLLAATSQALPRPETLLRWHRELVRRRLGRPPKATAPAATVSQERIPCAH